jgi:hypothetical protein
MKNMGCSFYLAHYTETIKRALHLGYKFYTFNNYIEGSTKEQCIILRHDIDFSIERALEMAKIEHSLGVPGTYFFRLHAKTYNPYEFKSYLILRQIRDMGHEVGLHTEALDVEYITKENSLDIFRREKEILEQILQISINSAAEHRDFTGLNRDWNNHFFAKYTKEEAGILNYPFEDRFFKDMKYISDSLGNWREGCMCKHLGKYRKLQILTHPAWWYHQFYHIG